MSRVERLIVEGLGRLPQFSHAGVAGDVIHVSGTIGAEGTSRVAGGIGAETTQTLVNIQQILFSAGATWDDVVKVNVYMADMAEFAAMNEAYSAFFGGTPPARIAVGGVDLVLGARVEMDCVAVRTRAARAVGAGASTALPRHTGFVESGGEQIYFEVVGEGGVPMVLSHGAGGNHAVWYQQVAPFAADRKVITWDHRGYGRSSDLAGLSGPEVAAGDLLAVLDHLGVDQADLVGQSMGGWTTVGAALARPGLARSLVLADTLGGITSPAIEEVWDRGPAARFDSPEVLGAHRALGRAFSARHPERAHLYQSLGGMGSADPKVMFRRLMQVTHDESEAARLTMPVLCLVGDGDTLIAPPAVRALAGLLPDSRIVELSGCGHSPYFEDPEAWNLAVRRFLDSL